MATILTYAKMQEIKKCSINNEQFLHQMIKETEFSDFKKLVGRDIYNAIITEIGEGISEELQAILDDGLYASIAYLTYANYIQQSNAIDTATGVRQKVLSDSEPVKLGQIKNMVLYFKDLAVEYYISVKNRLNQHFSSVCPGNSARTDNFSEIIGVRRKDGGNGKKTEVIII